MNTLALTPRQPVPALNIPLVGGGRYVLGLPLRTEAFLTDWRPQGLALDCSYPPRDEPKNHNDWTTALTVIDKVKPQRAWLTHISHKLDAWLLETGASSPHAAIAMDGDRVDLPAGLDRPSS